MAFPLLLFMLLLRWCDSDGSGDEATKPLDWIPHHQTNAKSKGVATRIPRRNMFHSLAKSLAPHR